MKLDNLIDALSAFRAKHGNIEAVVADPTRPIQEDGTVPWTENFLPGYSGSAVRADGSGTEDVLLLIPYPEYLTLDDEARTAMFVP